MDKDAVVHIYNGILLSHKKKCIWVNSKRWMNLDPIIQVRDKSERGKTNFICQCIHMESRKMVLMNLLAGQQWRYRRTDQTCGGSGRRSELDELREEHGNLYVIICKIASEWHRELCMTPGAQPSILWQSRGLGWGGGRKEVQEGGDIWIYMSDSCCCMAETNTIL